MPVSVIVGGQYGSEGKGKVALAIARGKGARCVIRVGGTNSGHTIVDECGKPRPFRQLPASVFAKDTIAVLPPGALIDAEIFEREVAELGLGPDRVKVSPFASLISAEDREAERLSGLVDRIGSTGSGTGAALVRRIGRASTVRLAGDEPRLGPYLDDTAQLMRDVLAKGQRIVIEGSQGFGLSVLHGGFYPHATSRDTTAAAFVSEAGLSPLDVDEIVLVLRAHPIRVAGNSGQLEDEMSWKELAIEAGLAEDYRELTTATKKVRRIGRFEVDVVRRAIAANQPTLIVLNHLDYVDPALAKGKRSSLARDFVARVESRIGAAVTMVGFGPDSLEPRSVLEKDGRTQPTSRQSLKAV
ncbi:MULTISPECIES: adenylosuccinate synthetase [unclassified Bradyrhizobium]|uniref:adenylosuccinate synthetase n=1 Tax=unclassified Bradyrhizobium TaxID=2631580 RepID=UPI002478B1E3|nr:MULTISPECIES: adenylosuccinate synthetase [unclassified Bradyrhizobium]WGR72874.1 adenylosuccinate synthetase [Bradyrhizobium sp. ISRA426]WGR77709.1 adenylosuccinate synthetase [Bradyrhizobium sp. ISRA430]WGR88114.1 adenylosuccinate synthetase [Bradyrhizobium sp. ISRA432]